MTHSCARFLVMSLFSLLISCEERIELSREFVIRKGEHYASPRVVETLQSNVLQFSARFDSSAVYDLGSAVLQDSKNKLLGFSDCNALHHDNSARFAWQWSHDRLEIWAYCYIDGERVEALVGFATLNIIEPYSITILEGEYIFRFSDYPPVTVKRGNVCTTGIYYKLWPYFGGSVPAPHKITILIRGA